MTGSTVPVISQMSWSNLTMERTLIQAITCKYWKQNHCSLRCLSKDARNISRKYFGFSQKAK